MTFARSSLIAKLAFAAVFAAAVFAAHDACAQISFGKMRDAAEKQSGAPKVDDDEADAFDVKPGEKDSDESDKPSAVIRRKPRTNTGTAPARQPQAQTKPTPPTPTPAPTNDVSSALDDLSVDQEEPAETAPARAAESAAGTAAAASGKRGPVFGKATSHKYRTGMIFRAAANGTCSNVIGTAPVPMDFPEQKVRTLEEEFPSVAKVDYRDLKEGGARQLVFKMRELRAGQGVQATALFEVVRYPLMPPLEPEIYEIPKRPSTEIRRYLKSGQYMESTSKTIRTLAKQVVGDVDGDWNKVDAIFKYVRDNVQYKEILVNKPMRGALAALKAREGDCEDQCALFIAMCRASDIPARLVRVPGHCWAEFYLVDDAKEGYWFPAQVAGTEPLGSLQDTRVILQKGDSFRLPETPKEESLYVKELFMGNVKSGGADPEHQFIQETDPRD